MVVSDHNPDQQKNDQSPSKMDSSKQIKYKMRLFIADHEHNSMIAEKNIKKICSDHLKNNFELQVIDVFEDYTAAIEENILVAPALVIDYPKKVKIFGNLRNKNKVLTVLELI